MSAVVRVSKNILVDKKAILHFIFSQKCTVFQDSSNQIIDNDDALWIDNVEALHTFSTSYNDIARCMDTAKTPFSSTLKNLDVLPRNRIDREYIADKKLTLNGKISILNQNNTMVESSEESMNLRFCILQILGKYSLHAILHNSLATNCEDISFLFGCASYTESNIDAKFNGITGIAWNLNNAVENLTTPVNTLNTNLTDNVSPVKPTDGNNNVLDGVDKVSKDKLENIVHFDKVSKDKLENIAHVDKVSKDKIDCIAELTVEQAETTVWKELRHKRLTASLFGVVLQAMERGRYPPSLFKTLLNEYDISNVPAIKWGVANENNAKMAYETQTGVSVKSTGLWLHSSGILGASPDGLLPDGAGLVEFKCPHSMKEMSVEEAIESKPNFYLKKMDDGTVYLDKKHLYYHQVQGMLYIIGREYCDFCVWTPVSELYVIRIEKDPSWEACLAKLINFYFKQFLPHIMGTDDEKCLYEGYLKLVGTVDAVLDGAKQKRVERKTERTAQRKAKVATTDKSDERENCELNVDFSALSEDDIVKIAAITSSPFNMFHSKLWFTMREHRLTSSSFHQVLSAVRRNSFSPSLYKSIMNEYFMNNTPAAKFTSANNSSAIGAYEHDRLVTVLPSGIWLDSGRLLGASVTGLLPDGKGIIDVRCLYKYRNAASIRDIVCTKDANFHLMEAGSDDLVVKPNHRIYHKIQGSLYLSKREYCDVITWTGDVYHVTRMQRDPSWEENLEILRKFYVEMLFPVLCNKWGYHNVIRDLERFGD